MKQWIVPLFSLLLLTSCKKDDSFFADQLIGKWKLIDYNSEYFINNQSQGTMSFNENLPYQYLHVVNRDSLSIDLTSPEVINQPVQISDPHDATLKLIHHYEFEYKLSGNKIWLNRVNVPQNSSDVVTDGLIKDELTQYYNYLGSDLWWGILLDGDQLVLKKEAALGPYKGKVTLVFQRAN
ncbi:MAG TPA: hypothetical protein PKA53_05505 [Sphingobacterium sp.]|nr:hypothetical protein [Sphingobacterium sp.]